MRSLVLAILLCGASVASAQAPAAKETLAATFVRGKKLKGRVSLDAKAIPLKDAIEMLSEQLIDQKLGPIVASAEMKTLTTPVTYQADDKPADEVVAGLLKTLDLGYNISSKLNDPTDGWLIVGKFGPKSEQPKAEPEAPKATPEDEKDAALKLESAAALQKDNKLDRAKTLWKYIVKHYPGTKAAKEAKKLLENVDK
ncbi:MAG: tetratricopeptide repeat protein [Fimbriiglobus sp.]